MTIDQALSHLEKHGELWDLGQIDAGTRRKLNRMAKQGKIRKQRALWPWIAYGTREKTLYTIAQ